MTNNRTVVLEVPHRLPPKAWVADSDSKIMEIASTVHNLVYETWTLETAIDCWGEKADIPTELLSIIESESACVEVTIGDNTEYLKPSDAVSELEASKEAIGSDLQRCSFFTVEEARGFVDGNDANIKAKVAVEEAIKYLVTEK